MGSEQRSVEHLRDYLRKLGPEARTLLVAELERGAQGRTEVPAAELILRELRRLAAPAPSAGSVSPQWLFFAFADPFLIDDNPDHKQRGRIVRTSLAHHWEFICRDLLPGEATTYAEQVVLLLESGDRKTAERTTRAFQDRVDRTLREALEKAAADDRARRRLAAQVGTPKALQELQEIAGILKARDAVAQLGARLPTTITNLADEQLENVKALLDQPSNRHADVFIYAVLFAMSRLAARWQLIRLAVKAAGTDDAERLAESSYALAVTAVFGELRATVWRLRGALKAGNREPVSALLKEIHDSARGLRSEINLSGEGAWARQLAALRGEISQLIEAEIESVPGRVRRLLRPRPSREIAPDSRLDPADIEEAEAAIELVGTCRTYAHELAINEVTLRVHSELQTLLDSGTSALLEALRGAADTEFAYRGSQVDAAVRFAAKVFGSGYASLLAKAAEVARADRKTVTVKV